MASMTQTTPKPELEIPPAEFIRLDLFPAILAGDNLPNALPGGVLDAKRIIVTDTHVLVFSDSPTGPTLLHVWGLVDIQGRSTIGWDVETDEGINFKVRRSTSCGCGSRLRGIFPYKGVPFRPMT